MDWPSERNGREPARHAMERENPASDPGPRGNQPIDERDFERGRERFLAVLGN